MTTPKDPDAKKKDLPEETKEKPEEIEQHPEDRKAGVLPFSVAALPSITSPGSAAQESPEEEPDPRTLEEHPINRLMGVVEDIIAQEKRVANKNIRDLKYELGHNAYPSMRLGFAAIVDYLSAIEEADQAAEEDQMRELIEDNIRLVVGMCERIIIVDNNIGDAIREMLGVKKFGAEKQASARERQSHWNKLVDWAMKTIREYRDSIREEQEDQGEEETDNG